MGLWPIGVGLSLLGTIASGLGDNLVRLSYSRVEGLENKPALCWRPFWVMGWGLTIFVDTACNAAALALAPLALILPLGAMHIFWGSVFAHFINKEKMGLRDMCGALILVAGCVLVLYYAPRDNQDRTFDQTLDVITSRPFILGQSVAAFLVILFVYVCAFVHVAPLRTMAEPALSGVLGASSNVMLKLTESLGEESVHRWEFYVMAVSTVCLAVSQLLALNNALKKGEAVTVVAIANSVLMVGGSIQGLVCFHTTRPPTTLELLMLVLGISVVVVGIFIMSIRRQQEPDVLDLDEEVYGAASKRRLSDSASPTNYNTSYTNCKAHCSLNDSPHDGSMNTIQDYE